jgi:hypothetical protein
MHESHLNPDNSGSDDQDKPPVAKKEPGTPPKVGKISSSGEAPGTGKSPTTPGQGEPLSLFDFSDRLISCVTLVASPPVVSQPSQPKNGAPKQDGPSGSSQPVAALPPPVALGPELEELIRAWLDKSGEEVKQIEFIVNFVAWISKATFFHSQQLEPTVGDPESGCPDNVEACGIKGLSIYTTLFDNVDMEIFTCKLCSRIVEGDLEAAIVHQRVHFRHSPYGCLATQPLWYVSLSPLCEPILSTYFFSAGCASQAKRRWSNTSSRMGTRSRCQRCSVK